VVGAIRGVSTLLGVVAAAFLIWLSTHMGSGVDGYWARLGLLAAAGFALVLAQVFGGWTKWGWPLLSGNVFLLGFLPAFFVAGWVLLAGQPDDNWFARHVVDWSGDLHVSRLVRHLRDGYPDVLAFGLGALLGFTVDTTGPRKQRPAVVVPPAAPPGPPPPQPARPEADEPPPTDAPAALAHDTEGETVVAPAPDDETRVVEPPRPGPAGPGA